MCHERHRACLFRRLLRGPVFDWILGIALIGCNGGGAADSVFVGHLVPRTGQDSEIGKALVAAAALTVDSWNHDATKSFAGRSVSVLHGDTASQVEHFAFQTTRLIAVNQVMAVVGGIDSLETEQIRHAIAVRDAGPVGFSAAGGSPGAPSSGLWCVGISPAERGKWLAKYAIDEEKLIQLLLIVDASIPGAIEIHRAFVKEFRHPDRRILAEHIVHSAEEIRAAASRWPQGETGGLVFVGRRDGLEPLLPVTQDGRVRLIYAGEDEERLWRQPPEAPLVFATVLPGDDASEAFRRLETDFRQRSGQDLSPASLATAEAFRVLLTAASKARSFRRETLKREIMRLEVELPSGPFWFEKDGEPKRTVSIFRLDRRQPRWLKSYRPTKNEK